MFNYQLKFVACRLIRISVLGHFKSSVSPASAEDFLWTGNDLREFISVITGIALATWFNRSAVD